MHSGSSRRLTDLPEGIRGQLLSISGYYVCCSACPSKDQNRLGSMGLMDIRADDTYRVHGGSAFAWRCAYGDLRQGQLSVAKGDEGNGYGKGLSVLYL